MTDTHYKPPPGPPPDMDNPDDDLDGTDSDPKLIYLITEIKDYQLNHGNLIKLVRFEEPTRVPAVGINVSCTPTPFPRRFFDTATGLQPAMNELYIRAASDDDWLYSVLRPQIESEPAGLVASLWDVHVKCREAGVVQEVGCGVFRSDYMLHCHGGEGEEGVGLRQVEMNTFSVAGACHAENVAGMHRYLLRRRIAEDGDNNTALHLGSLPGNTNITSLVASLSAAHHLYQRQTSLLGLNPTRSRTILMITQPLNFNIADERPIEYALFACHRCEWRDVLSRTHLGPDRELLFQPLGSDKEFEVSVVYYRAGYDAEEYSEESNGRGIRLMLELSRAIKCPDVRMHMVGFKSVQRALAEEGVVEEFVESLKAKRQVGTVRETFVPMHGLDSSPAGLKARELATDPRKAVDYVLKPNLEGGGHNVFRSEIPNFLSAIPEEQWHTYILMRLITPPADSTGLLLTSEDVYEGPVVSELGILGFAMWRRRESASADGGRGVSLDLIKNEAVGWTFKTKPRGVDEMSVVKGYGCFDCPLLV